MLAEKPKGIVLSPGPSDPDHAGICLDAVHAAAEHDIPLFGVCLGHQTIGQAFGATMHGKTSDVTHTNESVFKDLENPIKVTRYHSLIIDPATTPDTLTVTAETIDGVIMGVAHKTKPIHGVQFHPESIATAHGHKMLQNFLNIL